MLVKTLAVKRTRWGSSSVFRNMIKANDLFLILSDYIALKRLDFDKSEP